ncbi:uncharacterized protein EV154DRAFT_423107 [Mucor mucedo]|uniref:uncharacterized protein n=1 Tax=Mucor mucedo TaxID=29922 RepID=UPI00221EE61A|nr:uncharacterized protein EV154DRAFT_423107 [Mucor mucedo]KAI7889886.1 hypothetical protein EV154DRAFT_423107 [Mucor mucedo]
MSHHIKIHVENETLVLRGNPEESVGCVLRGCVVLHTRETMKAKSITLNLMGKMKVQWSERNHQHKQELVVLSHDWNFLPTQKKLHSLAPNVYKYPFEYVLPGQLAESIDSNSYGSLSYKLKVVVDRPAFLPNLIDRHPLRVIRQITPSYDHMSNMPMHISNEWTDKLDYKISVPRKIYSRGEQIPVEFSLMPKAGSGLQVRYLSCFLKEYTSFVRGGTTTAMHTESKIIRFFRDETFPSSGLHWHKTEIMSVPHSFGSVQCDTQNHFFKIEHKLKFTMSLINKQGELSELRASMPINIINQSLAQGDSDENELPTYENAWRSALYSPLPYLDSNSPCYSPVDESGPITPSLEPAADYFAYQPSNPCTVLPSYHSVLLPAHDGLPSYQ